MWTKTSTHTLCEPAKWKCIWRFHKSHLIQKFAGKTLRNRGGKHTLCERAQWKCICTWRFYKSHFIRKFTSKMPRTTSCGPRPRHTLCVSLRSSNALGDFTRATFYRNLQVKCRGPAVDQDPDTHFVRACAVKIHLEISQEQLATEIYE